MFPFCIGSPPGESCNVDYHVQHPYKTLGTTYVEHPWTVLGILGDLGHGTSVEVDYVGHPWTVLGILGHLDMGLV